MAKKLRMEELERKIELAPLTRQEIERSIRCKVLVVCEGSKTEPNYFKSFSMMRNSSSLVFDVLSDGGGINTLAVVDEAIKLREKAEKKGEPYDSVWAVFDKDGFRVSKKLVRDIAEYIDEHYVETHYSENRSRGLSRLLRQPETYPMQTASLNLADVVNQLDESFSQMLLRKIDEKGLTDSQCYKKANVDR